MGVKVATSCFQWTQNPTINCSRLTINPSRLSSQTVTSSIPPSSSKQCSGGGEYSGVSLPGHYTPGKQFHSTASFGCQATKLGRSKSYELWEYSKVSTRRTTSKPMRRVCSASLHPFPDKKFPKKFQELSPTFQISDYKDGRKSVNKGSRQEIIHDSVFTDTQSYECGRVHILVLDTAESPWYELVHDAHIERKANSVDLPLSLRIIKKKMQLLEGFRDTGKSAHCSVKKAFSSIVFMIEELHSFSLQTRELLFQEDLQGILSCVQKDMHVSFAWLFQQVLSQTPTLMVYVMILLANFMLHKVGTNAAVAAALPPTLCGITSVAESRDHKNQKFGSSLIEKSSASSKEDLTAITVGRVQWLTSGVDCHNRSNASSHMCMFLPDAASQLSSFGLSMDEAESNLGLGNEEEQSVRDAILYEVDHETSRSFVSLTDGSINSNEHADIFMTELLYRTRLAQDPNNPLLLANYAQFLYLDMHEYDRSEEFFKKAISTEPSDSETYSKYATFLWKARNDLWGAEETLLEAIAADPTNSYYAANYAHFLWSTGGEETCFPLNPPENSQEA